MSNLIDWIIEPLDQDNTCHWLHCVTTGIILGILAGIVVGFLLDFTVVIN